MHRRISCWFILGVVVFSTAACGCRPGPTPGPPPKAKTMGELPPSAVAPIVATAMEKESAEAKPVEDSEPTSADQQAPISTPSPQVDVSDLVSKERVLLLTPVQPLIIEFQLSIDGQPHTAALAQLVEEVLKLADADGDGRTLWTELGGCKRIKYGQYGNLPIEGENGEKQIVERYDIDRDRIVDETELPRFLTRNAGGARPFSIRGTADFRDRNRRGAATWRMLDADGDGALAGAELSAAGGRLAGRDADDDEILAVSDLDPQLTVAFPERMNPPRRRGPDCARLLGSHAEWSSVQLALEQAYGGSRGLRPDSFPDAAEWFAQLDLNGDGRLRRAEFEGLNDLPAHLVILAEFGHSRPHAPREASVSRSRPAERVPQPTMPRLRLISAVHELAASVPNVIEKPGRLTLSIGGILLTLYANDVVASEDFAARAKEALGMLDANKDGYLEKSEVPEGLQGQFGRFEAVDADEDGKAFPAEIEAFLVQQQAGLRAQIHARASDREDLVFAALDGDHDQRLDSREVQAAGERLSSADQNGDGQIRPDELPEVIVIGLARGSLENADATFRPPPVIARAADEDAPRWFSAMDANGDGAISRREFLGPLEKFGELDADRSGLVELVEASARGE